MPSVAAPTATAPPADPVRAALEDPDLRRKLAAKARAVLRGRAADLDTAVQSVCLRAMELGDRYDPERGSISGWVFGIAVNVFRELARAAGRQPALTPDLEDLLAARPDRGADVADARVQVERFLTRLSPDQQAAVRLRHLEDTEYPDIAARLGVTVLNARMLVSRGMNRLQQLAQDTHGEGQP